MLWIRGDTVGVSGDGLTRGYRYIALCVVVVGGMVTYTFTVLLAFDKAFTVATFALPGASAVT